MSAKALKQYMELANTISNQAQAIVQGKIPGPQLYAQVCLIQNNVETLKAWTPQGEKGEKS
jgi:hypothetical protein